MGRGTQQNIEVSKKTLRKKLKNVRRAVYMVGGGKIVSTYANRSVRNACFMPLSLITEGLLHGASVQVWIVFQILSFQQNPTSIQGNEVHSKKETASPDKDALSEGTP